MELGMPVIWVDIHKSIGGSALPLIKGRIIEAGDAAGQLVFANQSTPRGPLFIWANKQKTIRLIISQLLCMTGFPRGEICLCSHYSWLIRLPHHSDRLCAKTCQNSIASQAKFLVFPRCSPLHREVKGHCGASRKHMPVRYYLGTYTGLWFNISPVCPGSNGCQCIESLRSRLLISFKIHLCLCVRRASLFEAVI